MRKGPRAVRLIGAVALAMTLVSACVEESNTSGGGTTQSQGVIKIGLVAPFSGIAASIGRNMREGLQMAIDNLNAKGGVLGQQLELVARDNQFDPAKTSELTRELIDQDGVSLVIGPPGTTSYRAIDDLIRQRQVLDMPIVTGTYLADHLNPYTFRIMIPDDIQVGLVLDYAIKHGDTKFAIIGEDNETGKGIADLATKALAAKGIQPLVTESFGTDELDLSPLVLKAKQAGATAILIGSHIGPYAARIALAADTLGYKPHLYGLAGLSSYTYADLARKDAVGTVFVAPPIPQTAKHTTAVERSFYKEYTSRFFPDGTRSAVGADKVTGAAYLTFDAVNMWAAAARKADSTAPSDVADVLNSGFTFPAKDSSADLTWHYDAKDHEGIHQGDMWLYRWAETPQGISFKFIGDASQVAA